MSTPIRLDPLGPSGDYPAKDKLDVKDVSGNHIAELGLVPKLFVTRALSALRKAKPLPFDERARAIAEAGELFATADVGGASVEEYQHAACRVSGLPISVIRTATRSIAHRAANVRRGVEAARPQGAVADWRDPLTRTGRAVWVRRGEVFAVHASGAHPGGHGHWLEALALGYRVVVRPNQREPFTAHRLVSALRAAGFGADQVVWLPTEHEAGAAILRGADLAYGGDDVVRRFAPDPAIRSQDPGRSKILVTADADWREHLDTIADSVAHHGGAGCVNATAVLVEGDPGPLAEALAERLAALPARKPEEEDAVLPVQALGSARAVESFLRTRAEDAKPWLGGDGIAHDLGDGSAALRPAVHQVDRPDAPQIELELPFPCVWVAPWERRRGVEALRDTLTLTAITGDDELFDELVSEPTISNLHRGDHPTYWTDIGLPHDGYLVDFLMRTKAVIRG
ncbi:aldehyde dehydrogenase family protein [Saccharopolyspora taberi]|uniref:Aldehyde dehydrogenase family protein n=1 Tax=Saccharopolyspora taberi TaxID=60895 RepID=A0ABN3V3Q4_9PSEU